jgi:hypothetical protein
MEIQNVGFLAKTLALASPTPADLQNAYRGLSARGSVAITCSPAEIEATLLAAERAGFFGLRIDGDRITAHKGKEGPCYDTGRSARYLGSAAAVLDDDHHLLSGTLRVCEKTARLYASDAYQGRLEVSEPDGALLARLEKDPAPFDCDTFAEDAKKLASTLTPSPAAGETVAVYYPGPFKLLVLSDGAMVRRGRVVRLPAGQARELERRDGAQLRAGEAPAPQNFGALHRAEGAACLMGDLGPAREPTNADLDALDELPDAMKRRLQAILSRGEEYFILTGSDPAQKDGCCPSNDVGIANRLVEDGILDSRGELTNSECPVTLYAFASEIRSGAGKPAFVRNDALRTAVRNRLESGPRWSRKAALRLAFVAVLAAAVAILGWALFRQVRGGP